MNEEELLQRITLEDDKATVRGQNLTVERVLAMLSAGYKPAALLERYAGLETDDIQACLLYGRRHDCNCP